MTSPVALQTTPQPSPAEPCTLWELVSGLVGRSRSSGTTLDEITL